MIPSLNAREVRVKVVSLILLIGLLSAGIASVAASFVPFDFLRAKARGMSASGQAPFFDFDFYRGIQLRLRLIGAGNIAAALIGFLFRRQIFKFAEAALADSVAIGRDVVSAIRSLPVIDRLTITVLVVWAAFLRAPLLSQPMRYDEAYTFLQYSSHPFYAALSFYNAPNNHLLQTLLVRLSYLLFGNHPWALRLPVFIAGVCLVPATYAAARGLYRGGAVLAAALVASSSVLIEYSTNARGYEILALIFISVIPLCAYGVRHRNSAVWVLLAILTALGFYTIPIMLYPFGGLVLWLLSAANGDAKPNERSVVVGLGVAIGLAILLTVELYSPVLAVSGPKSVVANKWVVASPFHVFVRGLPGSLASTWKDWTRDSPEFVTMTLAAGFVVSLLWRRRCGWFRMPLPLILVLWIAPVGFVQRVVPFERVWLFALPLYFTAAAAGFAAAVQPVAERVGLRQALSAVAIAVSLFLGIRVRQSHSIEMLNHGRGLEALAHYLKGQLKPGDSVVAPLPSDVPPLYYFQKEGVPSSYVNAPTAERMWIVVNEVSGDTIERVLARTKINDQDGAPARLLGNFDSASVYEIIPRKASAATRAEGK